MKKWVAFWVTVTAILGLLLFWKNTKTYAEESVLWRIGKSLIDMGLILLCAIRLPALLIGWCVLWLTKPIEHPALRTTMAILTGMLLAVAGQTAIEILVLLSIFAVDLVTGKQGFLLNWKKAGEAEEKRKLAA
jgi:hypothetical protein